MTRLVIPGIGLPVEHDGLVLTMQLLSEDGIHICESADDLSGFIDAHDRLVWVDVIDASTDELNSIADEFRLHHLFLEDATKRGQRSKLEQLDDYAFVVAYTASLGEVHLFFGENWLVTVRTAKADEVEWDPARGAKNWQRLTEVQNLPKDRIDLLLYSILDLIVDEYFVRNASFEDQLEELESAILAEQSGDERSLQMRMLHLRREMVQFRRKIAPLREVISSLTHNEVSFVGGPSVVYFQDVEDHLLRSLDELDVHRELLGNTMDAHLALMGNRTNRVMKMMTSIAAVLLGSTLIAGIYGMNFTNLPELEWQYGYFMALGSMVVLTCGLTLWFRHKDWM